MNRLDRRAGRAYRRARQAGAPTYSAAFAAAMCRVTDVVVVALGVTADGAARAVAQFFSGLPYLPRRPIIHNGRKYPR